MKKSIASLLSLLFLCTMLVGAVHAESDLPPLTVSVAFVDSGMWDTNPDNSAFGKLLKEKFNLEVDPIALTWGDWKEKTSMWAASGQMPDYTLTFTDYFIWRDQEVSLGFPVSTFDEYPNLKDRVPANILPYLVDEDGLVYGVPRSMWRNSSSPIAAQGLYVNKEYLEMAGLDEPPTTLDGWFDFLKKAVDEDFSGKGTLGISADANIPASLITRTPFIGTTTWLKEDGQWILPELSKNNIEVLEFGRKLYQAGIIDRDIATRKGGDIDNLFNEGRLVAMQSNSDCDMMLRWIGPESQLASDWTVLTYGPASPVDGKHYHPAQSNYDGVMAFNPDISPEKMERILMVQDWACSPEGEAFVTFGVEGVHYQVNDDGSYENLCKTADGSLQAFWIHEPFTMFGRFVPTWNFEFAVTSPLHPKANLEMAQSYLDVLRANATIADANWGIVYHSSEERNNMPSITADYVALYLTLIANDEDIPAAYEAFREQAMVKVGAAVEETNMFAAEQGW